MVRAWIFGYFLWTFAFCIEASAQLRVPSQDTLSLMVGQMLVMGMGEGVAWSGSEEFISDVLEGKLGGVILYEYNLADQETAAHLRAMVSLLQLASPRPLWISIDEEGGRVTRLKSKYGFLPTKSAKELASLGVDSTSRQSHRMAAQLRSVGINVNFAPVLDMALNADNEVVVGMGRCYGSKVEEVVLHGGAVIAAHRKWGILPVGKHFPGHGSSRGDTHQGMVDVSGVWQMQEVLPYARLFRLGDLEAIMSAHIVNRDLDEGGLPATLSVSVMGDFLRGIMGFEGVIFSDDMQMQAIADIYTMEEAVYLAIQAGIDVLLFSNQVEGHSQVLPGQVHALLLRMVKEGRISEARIRRSYERITALKGHYGLSSHSLRRLPFHGSDE